MNKLITDVERDAVYKTIYSRRDVRREFKADPIPDLVLARILDAAHHAPSVGYMQPWDFIVIKDNEIKKSIKSEFERANKEAAAKISGKRKEKYESLKLEGITESPINICVTCDRNRTGNFVIGKTHNPDMDIYSTVCAIHTIWLAARAENIGVGWVSIIHDDKIQDILNIPKDILPIAYLCVGYVTKFSDKPDLEKEGWLSRTPVQSVIHENHWNKHT
ncbi:MAG: 5,6-dimethylbenzimidazole synthase [Candidatus Parabeggiatoa sp. nov. 1]|nr:MAG: 5,6-dimethylbenzimidazole synthase [Gammaproteobacteria bacterium]